MNQILKYELARKYKRQLDDPDTYKVSVIAKIPDALHSKIKELQELQHRLGSRPIGKGALLVQLAGTSNALDAEINRLRLELNSRKKPKVQ